MKEELKSKIFKMCETYGKKMEKERQELLKKRPAYTSSNTSNMALLSEEYNTMYNELGYKFENDFRNLMVKEGIINAREFNTVFEGVYSPYHKWNTYEEFCSIFAMMLIFALKFSEG